MAEPTPSPWFVHVALGGFVEVQRHTGEKLSGVRLADTICMMPFGPQKDEYKANAEHIVKCVNAHEELIRAAMLYRVAYLDLLHDAHDDCYRNLAKSEADTLLRKHGVLANEPTSKSEMP